MIRKDLFKIFVIPLVVAFYLVTRLQNLTAIPVFGDEAIYIRWSQIIKNVETLRFIPVTDGKQPFFMWLTVPFFKITTDPLVAGRLVSVLAGLGTIIGLGAIVFFITRKLVYSIIPAIIYICLPFSFFFDRLSTADNLLSMFGVWSLFLSLLLTKYPRFDLSFILGGFLGLAWLTKSPAVFFIAFVFVTFFSQTKNFKYFYLPPISAAIAFIIYNILRLGPQFHMIALRNQDYVWPVTEILKHPLDPFKPHLSDIISIYNLYISPFIFWSSLLIFLFLFFQKKLKNYSLWFILFIWWAAPLVANAAFAKVFTARYILYTLPPLILLISLTFITLKSKLKYLLIFLLIPNLIFISRLSLNPFSVQLTSTETGYLRHWTSGWGIKEAAQYLKSRSLVANVIVGTEGYFGTLPDGLQIYADHVNRLTIVGVGLGFTKIPENLIDAKNHGDEVYLLINQSRLELLSSEKDKLTPIKTFQKPGDDTLILFQL